MALATFDPNGSEASAQAELYLLETLKSRSATRNTRSFQALKKFAVDNGLNSVAPSQIIVGGTNGKSSVVAYLAQILSGLGLKVGITTSPHMHSILERIVVADTEISSNDFKRSIHYLHTSSNDLGLTYFDFVTLAALREFAKHQVDVAIIEVGLGGRLDCANVVDADVSVITNVALDHQERLGDTIEQISKEKVHIARPGKRLIYGETVINQVITSHAARVGAVLMQRDRDFGISNGRSAYVTNPNRSERRVIQLGDNNPNENLCTALQAAACLSESKDLTDIATYSLARPSGRFQNLHKHGKWWIFDVAHNPAAIAYLRQELIVNNVFEADFIFGCLREKNIASMLGELTYWDPHTLRRARVCSVNVVPSIGARGLDPTKDERPIPVNDARIRFFESLEQAVFTLVMKKSTLPIVICGSFDVVSRAVVCVNRMQSSGPTSCN